MQVMMKKTSITRHKKGAMNFGILNLKAEKIINKRKISPAWVKYEYASPLEFYPA
jgi:hypothetical protein